MSRRRVQTARLGCILSCHKWHACAPCSSPTIAPPGCAPCMRCNTAGMGTPPPCVAPHPPLLRPRLLQVRHAQQGAAQSPKISQAVHSRQVQGSKRQRLGEPADGAGGTGSQLAKSGWRRQTGRHRGASPRKVEERHRYGNTVHCRVWLLFCENAPEHAPGERAAAWHALCGRGRARAAWGSRQLLPQPALPACMRLQVDGSAGGGAAF